MTRLLVTVLAAFLFACSPVSEPGDADGPPDVLNVGVLPDQAIDELESLYAPLLEFLIAESGLRLALSFPQDYDQLLRDFEDGRVHLALFGGLTFVRADARGGAEPLVMRDVDLEFSSCYLTRADDAATAIEDYAGQALAFGPRLSTSGHLMPRHFLSQSGVEPESLFGSVRHSAGHDETTAWVVDGTVAVGAVNCQIYDSMLGDRRLEPGVLRVLARTPTYANYVWTLRPSIDDGVKTRLRDAFMALDAAVPAHAAILDSMGTRGYLPAARQDFDDIRAAALAVNLLSDGAGR